MYSKRTRRAKPCVSPLRVCERELLVRWRGSLVCHTARGFFLCIGLAVAFRPDGHEVAVATLNGHLTFFETQTAQQVGCIEARHDLGYARSETDKVTAKKLASNRHAFFPNLQYFQSLYSYIQNSACTPLICKSTNTVDFIFRSNEDSSRVSRTAAMERHCWQLVIPNLSAFILSRMSYY